MFFVLVVFIVILIIKRKREKEPEHISDKGQEINLEDTDFSGSMNDFNNPLYDGFDNASMDPFAQDFNEDI